MYEEFEVLGNETSLGIQVHLDQLLDNYHCSVRVRGNHKHFAGDDFPCVVSPEVHDVIGDCDHEIAVVMDATTVDIVS